ncbi:MAG: hypothetical protein ACTSP3_12555 [Candidatus Heimdallarchaeaceae archaeon]
MNWIVSYNKLKEYNLDDPYPTWGVGFAIRHKIDPTALLAILSIFVILTATLVPRFFIFNDILNLITFFISLFTVYFFFSLHHSRFLIELFRIEHLLKDDEFIRANKIRRTWTPNQLAIVGCVLIHPKKFEKTELSEKINISSRQIHQYLLDGLLKREGRGYTLSSIRFKVKGYRQPRGFKRKFSRKKKDIENALLELFKLRCIFQYNFIMKRKSK